MSIPFSRIERLSAVSGESAAPRQPADRDRLHEDVIGLFDRYRGPLLQYLSSFGIACPDGEEIIQEVFLSLLRHLELGKPRQNLLINHLMLPAHQDDSSQAGKLGDELWFVADGVFRYRRQI